MAKPTKQPGEIAGVGECPNCKRIGHYQINKSGNLYFHCAHPNDGGCLTQIMSRCDAGNDHLSRRIKQWAKPDHARRFVAGELAPPPPSPEPEPESESQEKENPPPITPTAAPSTPPSTPRRPAPQPKPKKLSWWEAEIL